MAKNQSSNSKKTSKSGAESRIARKREKAKPFERYEQKKPIQLTFFEILEPENKQYSNTVEIYDFLPKEFLGNSPLRSETENSAPTIFSSSEGLTGNDLRPKFHKNQGYTFCPNV